MEDILDFFMEDEDFFIEDKVDIFIKNHQSEYKIYEKYITYSEIIKIAEKNNLDEDILRDAINKANDIFIKNQIPICLKKFKCYLFSIKSPINEKTRNQLESEYKRNYFNFYRELNFNHLIDIWEFLYKEYGYLIKYSNLLSLEYIDEKKHESLKKKYVKSDYFFNEIVFDDFIDDLNISIVEYYKSKSMTKIKSILSSCDNVITKETRLKLKSKYDKYNYNNLDDLIDNHNVSIIKSEGKDILKEFNSFLDSYINFIDDDCYSKLESKYNTDYCNYFEDLDFDNKIQRHNRIVKPKIIKKELTSQEGLISNSECLELKSKYNSIDWDSIAEYYNNALINNQNNIRDSFILNREDKFDDSNIDELDESIHDVFYLEEYVKYSYWDSFPEYKDVSRCLLDYKDNDEDAIEYFTSKLIEAIIYISNNYLDENIDSIALISIPPSKVYKNASSPMRKSINLIKKCWDNQLMKCDKEILDYSNLLYRYSNVPTAHKCKAEDRPVRTDHINSILCTKKDFANDNIAFILMDDITTRGEIMYACEEILINNGVKNDNIFKLSIAETMWVY